MTEPITRASLVTVVGDVMPGRKVALAFERIGLTESAALIRRLLSAREAVGNLECPLCRRQPSVFHKPDGGPNLRGDPAMAHWLKKAGFTVMSLANNHMMDCGPEGLCETIETLHSAGIATVGAGRNLAEAVRPLILPLPDCRIALLAFGNGVPATERGPGVCPFSTERLQEGLAQVPPDVGAVIVLVHAGLEFLEYPESWTMRFFTDAVRGGADVVIGGHSHCLRGVGRQGGSFLAYGIGDFLMDTADAEHLKEHLARTALTRLGFPIADPQVCRQGLAVDIDVHGEGSPNCRVRPVLIGDDFLPREPTETERAALNERMEALSRASEDGRSAAMRRTRQIERAYRAVYGTGRSWRDWLTLPWRVARRHVGRRRRKTR